MSVTSPEAGFTPRREFLRDQPITPNSFSLLAISGANCIRLYSFPLPLMTALRRLFDQQNLVTALREDVDQQLCEIALVGKPWTSAKSVETEKLLLDMLGVIYQHGYTYLSTIDYGRESDDRLAMAFSKPAVRALSPLSPSESPLPASLSLNRHGKRVPFALSFTSATIMRVIAPPLHSTPAILQAVRGAWPRGVVSEKKVGANCFEFKLKGYKWFHEDTFATDSLRYILSLLSSLDAHSFTLLTSITLTSRSRVKDLWIFTGPAASSVESLPESPAPSILGSHSEFRRAVPGLDSIGPTSHSQQSLHRRLASEPSGSAAVYQSHARAATDSPAGHVRSSSPSSSNVLRKAAPRAQVPQSVYDSDSPAEMPRANLPSVVPESVQDFTGVGASRRTPDVLYSTSPFGHSQPAEAAFPLLLPIGDGPNEPSRSPTPPPREGSPPDHASPHTHPLIDSSSPPHPDTPPLDLSPGETMSVHSDPPTPGTPPLLSPGAFRDSAFSSATNSTYEPIPIKWTGVGRDSRGAAQDARESVGPNFPGGWQPTPIDEKPEDTGAFDEPIMRQQDEGRTPDVQEVTHRVASPDFQAGDLALRKSEAGLVGLIAASENQNQEPSDASEGKGWVVIDVEGKGDEESAPMVVSPEPQTPATPVRSKDSLQSGSSTPGQQTVSPAAKAIALVDAIEAKNKSGSKAKAPSSDAPSGGLRRKLFSIGRKNSNPPSPSASVDNVGAEAQEAEAKAPPAAQVSVEDTKRAIDLVHGASSQEKAKPSAEKEKEKPAPKWRLRDKLRLIGTPEASRNEDKRRSIH
ncbi:hypothetical protein B0H17DRAFT_1089730 [Mycena rosella]|uniref:Uncharacterized protein n=1 Tax=Mycena rosella TaxID=1033263 RepID=A0AAD7G745_MYCRO|nr:hypothetical protein B0H17DRAFT_1089730 [Mycena rosella]